MIILFCCLLSYKVISPSSSEEGDAECGCRVSIPERVPVKGPTLFPVYVVPLKGALQRLHLSE